MKWFKNNLKLHNNHHNILIEKRHSNDYTFAILVIKNFRPTDEGTYTCKYDNVSDKSVNIYIHNGNNQKSSSKLIINASVCKLFLDTGLQILQVIVKIIIFINNFDFFFIISQSDQVIKVIVNLNK